MIFSYRKQIHLTNVKFHLQLYIEETNNIEIYGIIFDKHLTFKNHADMIAQKISKSVGILFKSSRYLPLAIINALYGIEVWHDKYANKSIIKYSSFEKRPFNTHTNEHFKNVKHLKLPDLNESQISKHMPKCSNLNDNILPKHCDINNYI